MSRNFLPKSSLWFLLLEIDVEFRDGVQASGCPHCGGRLDRANYLRKPRGGDTTSENLRRRFSLCCAAEGCRRRSLPPSTRFLDRRVYLCSVVVLVGALRQGPSPKRMKTITAALGVDRRTVERWCEWWRTTFVSSFAWRELRARLSHPEEPVPRRLDFAFDAEKDEDAQASAMRFFALSSRSSITISAEP